jgi:hypothetical protein
VNPSPSVLNVEKKPQLWPDENTRACISDDQIRQVGRSAVDVTLPVKGPARRLSWGYLGGDAYLGPRRATNTPHGLTTENSAQIPKMWLIYHRLAFFDTASILSNQYFLSIFWFLFPKITR